MFGEVRQDVNMSLRLNTRVAEIEHSRRQNWTPASLKLYTRVARLYIGVVPAVRAGPAGDIHRNQSDISHSLPQIDGALT